MHQDACLKSDARLALVTLSARHFMFGAPAHKAKLDPAQEAVPKRSRGGDAMKGHQHMPTSRAQQARERWLIIDVVATTKESETWRMTRS